MTNSAYLLRCLYVNAQLCTWIYYIPHIEVHIPLDINLPLHTL